MEAVARLIQIGLHHEVLLELVCFCQLDSTSAMDYDADATELLETYGKLP